MDLDTLETFRAVAAAGSFAAYARQLNVAPSSVSRQIAGLEKALQVRLFDRTTRRLVLTEAGATYLARITPLLEDLTQAGEAARDQLTDPTGRLRVATSVAFAERWLLPRLSGFAQRYPKIQLDLQLSDTQVDLRSEGIDLAIRFGAAIHGDYVVRRLRATRYHLVASPGYLAQQGRPNLPLDLQHQSCLQMPYPGFETNWRIRQSDKPPMTVPLGPGSVISNPLALRRAALLDLGIAMLADWMVEEDLTAGALIDLFPDHEASPGGFDTAAWILYPTRSYVPAKLRAFVDWITAAQTHPDRSAAAD